MLLSVIVVTFNAAGSIRSTLDSIAAQKNAEIDCLVVDGASTDATVEIARGYAGRIPGLRITSEADKGLYDAMNKGIALASGHFVLFLNAGDVFHDSNVVSDFARLIESVEEFPTMIYGHTQVVLHDGKRFVRRVRGLGYVNHGQPTIHQSVFFRRDRHLAQLYPFERYPISADYASMALLQHDAPEQVFVWDRVVSDFHNDPCGVSNSNLRQRIVDAWRIQRDLLGVPLRQRLYSVLRRMLAQAFYNSRPNRRR